MLIKFLKKFLFQIEMEFWSYFMNFSNKMNIKSMTFEYFFLKNI